MMTPIHLWAIIISLLVMSSGTLAEDSRGLQPKRPLFFAEAHQTQGHSKLVAILVVEDYRRTAGRPDWGRLGELPGVWQDLARVERRLRALGFGQIVVLGSGERKGSRRTVSLKDLAGLSEWESGEQRTLTIDGPATRAGIVAAANQLRDHLNVNRTADDGNGREVPPVFAFYYSGHGFVDSRGVHRLPLADNVAGEPTGDLLRLVLDTVGADDLSRGSAGGGTSLVFLDCCQAGQALTQGAKAGSQQAGLLEASIMDAIRAGRRGRFFVGASLGDETAKENSGGGHFTGALCAVLHPDNMGKDQPGVRTLSLNHLVLSVDQLLLKQGGQAVSRVPAAADPQWENWPLFPNPHYQGQVERLRLIVRTLPPGLPVQVLGWEEGGYKDLGLFAAPFLKDAAGSQAEQRVYRVPESWRGHSLRLQAAPVRIADRIQYGPSSAVEVMLEADAQGTPPIAALALIQVKEAIGMRPENAAFERAQDIYEQAQRVQDSRARFRQLQTAQALLKDSQHAFADAVRRDIATQLDEVRPEAGQVQLEELIQIARAPADEKHYRQAYDGLAPLEDDPVELREFGLDEREVAWQIVTARQELLQEWRKWAEEQRQAEAEQRLVQGEAFLSSGQPWHSWRQAFEAEILVGPDERTRGLAERSARSAAGLFSQQQVSLEVLVSNSAYGILRELVQGSGRLVDQLREDLSVRFRLSSSEIGEKLQADMETFWKTHAPWFPPETEWAEDDDQKTQKKKDQNTPRMSFSLGRFKPASGKAIRMLQGKTGLMAHRLDYDALYGFGFCGDLEVVLEQHGMVKFVLGIGLIHMVGHNTVGFRLNLSNYPQLMEVLSDVGYEELIVLGGGAPSSTFMPVIFSLQAEHSGIYGLNPTKVQNPPLYPACSAL
jgi:hypothetical protein